MISFRYYTDPVFEKQHVYYDHSLLRCDAVYNGIQIKCQLLPGSPQHSQAAVFLYQNIYSNGSVFIALVTVDVSKQSVLVGACMALLLLPVCIFTPEPTFQGNVQLPPSMQKAADTYILNNKYHSPEHHNLNIYHCEKLKSHKNVYGSSIITSYL